MFYCGKGQIAWVPYMSRMVGQGRSLQAAALHERLALLGLTPKEAAVYVLLCVQGPMRAGELAAAARMHRTDVYRATERLVRDGFATASLGRPTTFEAIEAGRVFDDAVAAHGAQARALAAARDEAVEKLATLRSEQRGPALPGHRLLHGRPAIYAAVDAMLRRARTHQWMASTYFAAPNATASNTPFATTRERAAQGLGMRLLLRETPGLRERLQTIMLHSGVEARFHRGATPLRFTIVDDREMIVWLATDPSPALTAREDVAMWTNAPDFIASQKLLYEALWTAADPLPPP